MRYIAPAILLATSLALAGCAGTGTVTIPTLPPVTPLINLLPPGWQGPATDIQNKIIAACGWSEPIENIVNIAATFAGVGAATAVVSAVVNAVCTSVKAKGVRRGVVQPRAVRGVALRGGFVR